MDLVVSFDYLVFLGRARDAKVLPPGPGSRPRPDPVSSDRNRRLLHLE